MVNNGHYLYMLNKYETSAYWTKETKNGTILFTNWKIQLTIITWKECENLQQTNHITLKDILYVGSS